MECHQDCELFTAYFRALSQEAGSMPASRRGHGKKGWNAMIEILGSPSEIKMTWRCKPELRVKMIRYMMRHRGYPGVKELARVLSTTYRQLYDLGGLEGWLKKRRCQRRQRRNRQKKKTDNFTVNSSISNSNEHYINGSGKIGKGGARQDIGSRLITQSTYK